MTALHKGRPWLNNGAEARRYRTASGSERDQGTNTQFAESINALHLIEELRLYPARYRSRFCNVRGTSNSPSGLQVRSLCKAFSDGDVRGDDDALLIHPSCAASPARQS